jgi:hypothetical protein
MALSRWLRGSLGRSRMRPLEGPVAFAARVGVVETPLTDIGLWARSSGLEIVQFVTGAILSGSRHENLKNPAPRSRGEPHGLAAR